MNKYQDIQDLTNQMYEVFASKIRSSGVDPLSGSGQVVYSEIRDLLEKSFRQGDIPASFDADYQSDYSNLQLQHLRELPRNMETLADIMLDDAREKRDNTGLRLHETSWRDALDKIKKLCPIFPFC